MYASDVMVLVVTVAAAVAVAADDADGKQCLLRKLERFKELLMMRVDPLKIIILLLERTRECLCVVVAAYRLW